MKVKIKLIEGGKLPEYTIHDCSKMHFEKKGI